MCRADINITLVWKYINKSCGESETDTPNGNEISALVYIIVESYSFTKSNLDVFVPLILKRKILVLNLSAVNSVRGKDSLTRTVFVIA